MSTLIFVMYKGKKYIEEQRPDEPDDDFRVL